MGCIWGSGRPHAETAVAELVTFSPSLQVGDVVRHVDRVGL